MGTWVLCLLLEGLSDMSGEEAQDILETYTDSPIVQFSRRIWSYFFFLAASSLSLIAARALLLPPSLGPLC